MLGQDVLSDELLKNEKFKATLNDVMSIVGLASYPDSKVSINALDFFLRSVPKSHEVEPIDKFREKDWTSVRNSSLSTGSAKTDAAAGVLQILYHHQLRELQTKINEIISDIQKITAKPSCDLNLGKVGR